MSKQKGFTLIELVMVIVILGILSAVAIPKYVNMQDQAKSATAKGVIGTMRSALNIQYANNALNGNAVYPTTAQLTVVGSASIFADGKVPDSPVPADTAHLNDVKQSTAGAGAAIADFDNVEAYIYNPNTGEIRFNNTAVDPVTSKAWSTF